MKLSFKKGFSFGLTSGIITTLGLIVGLNSGTHSRIVVIGGICIIAIADALSDALGMHISEEAGNKHTKQVWEATFATFFSKFFFALTFVIPFLFLELSTAIPLCILWGLFLMTVFNYYLAKQEHMKPYKIIIEHVLLAIVVILLTNLLGTWIATWG